MAERQRVREYQRPVVGKLVVELENGERWTATDDDLKNFGLIDRLDAQYAVRTALESIGCDVEELHSSIRHIIQMHVAGTPESVEDSDKAEARELISGAKEEP